MEGDNGKAPSGGRADRRDRNPGFGRADYVVFDPVSHKCLLVHDQPSPGMRLLGMFKAESQAKTAMASMKACRGKPS